MICFSLEGFFYLHPKEYFMQKQVFRNCGDQEVKLGYRLLFVLKHLEIITKKKLKIPLFLSHYIGNIKFKIGTRKAI